MHDVLNRNLRCLERRSHDLADRLREIIPDPSLELLTAESGELTVKKNSGDGSYQYLHSKINPRREATIWAETQHMVMPCLVIVGIGLAYHAVELFKRHKEVRCAYLIEADEHIFHLAMKIHDLADIIQNPSVHFLIGSPLSVIEPILSRSLIQPFSRHIFSPIVSSSPDAYSPVMGFIEKHLYALRLKEVEGENPSDLLNFARGVENLLQEMKAT